MTTRLAPTSLSTTRVTIPVLALCAALSVLVHIGSAVGAGAYLSERSQMGLSGITRIRLPELSPPPQPEEDPLRLGRQESRTASIAWLGVVEDPLEGQGQESTVEQAELTRVPGEQDAPAESVPVPGAPAEVPEQQSIQQVQAQEPVLDPAEQTEAAESDQDQSAPDEPEQGPTKQLEVAEPKQATEPTEETIDEPVEQPQAELTSEPSEQTSPVQEQSPEPVIESNENEATMVEPAPQPQREPQPEDSDKTASEQSADQSQQESEPESQPEARPTLPTTSPKPQGKPGEVDDRESTASIIKRAVEHRATDLNRPLSGEGLEIKPVEPKFPATVRFTQLPRNPIVLIRFNAEGRVVKAAFLRDEEKRRVYDTGSKGVDEPLINAIYQWRAEGKQIDALDPDDPNSTIEIPMKILFRDE